MWHDAVVDPGAAPFGLEQPGGAQHLQVVRNGRLATLNPDRQVADAGFAAGVAGHHAEQPQPHRIRKSLELDCELAGRRCGQWLTRQWGDRAPRHVGQGRLRLRHMSILTDIKSVHKRTVGERTTSYSSTVTSPVKTGPTGATAARLQFGRDLCAINEAQRPAA